MQKCQWHVLSVADLFERHLQFRLTPQTSKEELIEVAGRHRIDVSRAVDFDEVFFFLFLEKIEPELKNYDCLFLHSYPPSQAALARLTSEGWGDRFEFYIRGLEIANAFNELNDPKVQRVRSQEDLDKKAHHGRMPIGLDEEFFQYLEGGMPPSCGIALGLERLFMALHGYKSIEEFRLFVKK
jgi:lysyl-tRNA synthetase class 2